eukprot:10508785-Prorocentrum_lima.AAC.1
MLSGGTCCDNLSKRPTGETTPSKAAEPAPNAPWSQAGLRTVDHLSIKPASREASELEPKWLR